jgi:DnaJ-domain-containing protein 1
VADNFQLLSEPRRPSINIEQLKAKFLALSAELHPDRTHESSPEERRSSQDQFTQLNSAYQCLLQPRDRLAHLLELESGQKPQTIQSAPHAFMDLFMEVGGLCSEVDKFLERKRAAASPLLQVSLFERGQELADRINALQHRLKEISAEYESQLHQLNRVWEKAPAIGDPRRVTALPLGDLENHYRAFSYLSRWSAQLQERLVQLAL